MLRERDRDLTVSSTDVKNGGALTVEKFKESVLLNLEHPLTNGIPESGRVFVRGGVKIRVLGVS
jgi:hypothetical protein